MSHDVESVIIIHELWKKNTVKEVTKVKKGLELSTGIIPSIRFIGVIVCLLLMIPGVSTVWAGPPFRTDDPEPADYKHGEFYIASQYFDDKGVTSGTAPHIEFNYGLLPDMHVHLIAPFVYNKPSGESTQYGFGDIELGVKYRFYNNEEAHFMIGTFPIMTLPSGQSSKGLGEGHINVFIPLWVQKSWGPWTTYGGGGFWYHPGTDNKNYWFIGWEVQREISKTLTLGAELFDVTKKDVEGKNELGFNIGAIINITEDHHILVSAGRDISGDNRFQAYLAYQFTFGPKEGKKEASSMGMSRFAQSH